MFEFTLPSRSRTKVKNEWIIPIYTQQDATLHSLFYLKTVLHVSGGTTTHYQERSVYKTHHEAIQDGRGIAPLI
jgi:hypothetical protein